MFISHETPTQTEARLRKVLAGADWHVCPGLFAFREFPATAFPNEQVKDALAFVRDEQVWSVLLPCADPAAELLTVFSFHFAPGLDNSGFVGWLASGLKATLGTGVLVVCGHNRARGGVFDYWGVPASLGEAALAEVKRLRHLDTTV